MCFVVTVFGWGKGSSPLLAQSGAPGQGGLGYRGERRDLFTQAWRGAAALDSEKQSQVCPLVQEEVLPWELGGEVGLGQWEREKGGLYPHAMSFGAGTLRRLGCCVCVFVPISGNRMKEKLVFKESQPSFSQEPWAGSQKWQRFGKGLRVQATTLIPDCDERG